MNDFDERPFEGYGRWLIEVRGLSEATLKKNCGVAQVLLGGWARVPPVLTFTSRIATKNYRIDLSVPGKAPKVDRAELEYFRRPTKMLPTDGIVKATADEITRGAKTDLQKAHAIYRIRQSNRRVG